MNEHSSPNTHDVLITVNEKPVHAAGPRTTGRAIKAAAIAQGVQIQADFVLSEEIGERRTRVIGDDDEITIHPHSRFIAVAPDDNS